MVCSSGVGFNPVVNGKRYHFQLFGLYDAVMVMSDEETGSIWSHLGGGALDGPMQGAQLELIPLIQTTWEQWLELHPDSLVLSDETPYKDWYSDPGLGNAGFGPEFVRSIVNWDDRLPPNDLVLGVGVSGAFRAYPRHAVSTEQGVVNDVLAGEPIVIFMDGSSAFSVAYSREVDGRILQFENASDENLEIFDIETGSAWNLEGRAIAGPLEGEALTFVTSYLTEWYGWAAYHPTTDIYPLVVEVNLSR